MASNSKPIDKDSFSNHQVEESDPHVSLNLLDGASAEALRLPPELETQKKVAADTSRPLEERIEAFEDIMDSEVGDTTMSRARNIEREVGFRQM